MNDLDAKLAKWKGIRANAMIRNDRIPAAFALADEIINELLQKRKRKTITRVRR